ncbi:46 kDa FK506-binding nuclear protein [Diabrotica virgifera virgifera]|uniref:FK506-binding protein n=1 Tax=Diabrotica virgifera virgifera TaxID=50390 RepID=A0ABM5KTZ5_DIAVI|nr:46 kDa FK506-binding nuclear protein [Diabrotica virgifera virgifera]
MFWGLIMEPQRRYLHVVKKAFHISMASLDVGTSSDEPAQVMCSFEGRNYLLCTLSKTVLQCPLDLNFEVGDEIALTTNGKCHIHLTGYFVEEAQDFLGEEEEEEEIEEEVEEKEVKKKNKKRNKQELNGPSPKKVKKEQKQEESEDDDDSEMDVTDLLENTLDSDDDDESFNGEENAEEEESGDGGEEEDDDEDESGDEQEQESESDDESEEEVVENKKKAQLNGHVKKQEQQTPKQKDKKNKKQQQNKEEKSSPTKENQSPKKDSPKKVVQGGMIIEDLKEGQGQPAKNGRFVHVYYEGRLKNNNKMFDSHKQGQGFAFKLGSGEVIKGWDVGLVGMKVGGKRRITCPPQMAYGVKGSPPAIPGNSTLVFEVELKKIR